MYQIQKFCSDLAALNTTWRMPNLLYLTAKKIITSVLGLYVDTSKDGASEKEILLQLHAYC